MEKLRFSSIICIVNFGRVRQRNVGFFQWWWTFLVMRFFPTSLTFRRAWVYLPPYSIPWRKYLSDSPSGGYTASSIGCFATGYTGDASGVGRATGVDTVNSRVNANKFAFLSLPLQSVCAHPKSRTTQKRPLRKDEIVELCEAFHLRTGEVRIHSPQNLMSKNHAPTLAYMASGRRTVFG